MEQMLYAFQKTGKVLSALKEARETFEPGHMRDIMDESIGHLEAGHSYSEKSVLRESLDIVEKEYECRKIKTLHELLISAEEYGGEADDSISLLLMMWNYGNAEVTCFREKRKKHIQTMWYPLLWLQPYVPELYIC